jgi:cell division protein FtsN
MKEFITITIAFFMVVALSLYMYINNQKNNISFIQYEKTQEILLKDNEQLKRELEELKNHIHTTDSIYHK